MTKKVLVSIPVRLLEQLDLLAQIRCQTRSELIRESLRCTLDQAKASPGTLHQFPLDTPTEKQLTRVQ